jgi:UDP-N-acetyl-D-galactosamine dehydrogenase
MFKIAIIGLGYVGLPLAIALSRRYSTKGFEIQKERVQELHRGYDRTREIDEATLRSSSLEITGDLKEIQDCTVYIVTVPTPVTSRNEPDLTPLQKASEMIGTILKVGDIVVYESTVYPGVTENFCGPILASQSKLVLGRDFYLGYSPERINPGDREHTIDQITKVISGQTPEVVRILKMIYGSVNENRIFVAENIKTAEAAKVIENTQRDINIAFINEVTLIFSKMGISIYDVLDAAKTKWNFLPFSPGLVGGHCIGVDPYYLATAASRFGLDPKIILAGRSINESMAQKIVSLVHERWAAKQFPKVLVLGLTFKENVPDLRNTKIIDLIQAFQDQGYQVQVHDPCAIPQEAAGLYQLKLLTRLEGIEERFDLVVGAVAHDGYQDLSPFFFDNLLNPSGVIVDLKKIWNPDLLGGVREYWSL